jgi:hypothetical protein
LPHRPIPILVCAALALLGLAATASAAPEPWGLMQLRAKDVPLPEHPAFRDTILRHPSKKARAAAAAGTDVVLTAPDGTALKVTISNAYGQTPMSQAAAQNAVNFLASRVHGTELGLLKVFVGPPSEISSICGEGDPSVLACYAPDEQRMYVPGETPPNSPVPLEYIITHEFAHHIALHRRNAVGPAFGISASDAGYILGPEYWATSQYICAGVKAGAFFPNDEGAHYPLNPGEGWAESYAHLPENGFESAAIQTSPLFHLDQAAFDAIRRDVLQPWTGNATRTVTGSLGSKSQQRFGLVVSLDGPVLAKLSGPRGANYDLQVRLAGEVVDRSSRPGSNDRVGGTLCAAPQQPPPNRLTFVVIRRSGSGPFKLKLTDAG